MLVLLKIVLESIKGGGDLVMATANGEDSFLTNSLVNQTFTLLFSFDRRREWYGDTCVNFVFPTGISVEPISSA